MTDLLHGATCGLYVDMPLGVAVVAGDWVATEAGARYLVLTSRKVNQRSGHRQQDRYSLRCARLERDIDPPDDVHVVWLRWYTRGRRRRA